MTRAVLLAALAAIAGPAAAQHPSFHWSAVGVLGVSRMDPAPGGSPTTQFAVDLATLMARIALAGGRVGVLGSVSFEGATIPDGVLTPGAMGEGFVDRRHPHTWVHEILAVVRQPLDRRGVGEISVSAGKGFVAFGADDPMNRPVLRYPVNHHWGQILERAVVMLGARAGPVALEGTLFNGDEPERPWQAPNLARFGDSWALRATVRPTPVLELQASHAKVQSPEHREGAGPEAVKWSASARFRKPWPTGGAYGLVEWNRTEVAAFFEFFGLLAEAELRAGAHRPYYRFERTDRPEEERTDDPFRVRRPHHDDALLGITRWTVHTVGYGFRLPPVRGLTLEPLVEVARAGVAAVGGGVFRPADFYGDDTIWSFTFAVRVGIGPAHRMGRYGVLEPAILGENHAGH